MRTIILFILALITLSACNMEASRKVVLLDEDWQFINKEVENGQQAKISTEGWETVSVPHDWAISGEFDESIDAQETMVIEDGERVPKFRTGRTGGLPHIGIGWYRKALDLPSTLKNKRIHVEFDGAMSHAKVYLNGEFVGEWPYGYASFGFDITDHVNFGGENILAVRLENPAFSSRWYPGAGIYRNVRMVVTNPVFVKQWGTYLTTPEIKDGKGTVNLKTRVLNQSGESRKVRVETQIISPAGESLASISDEIDLDNELTVEQNLDVPIPKLWSLESPTMYKAVTRIFDDKKELDKYETPFGFRYFEFTNNEGFYLNGERVQLNGVCLHHDLGPLGSAVNLSSLRHRMKLLQEMGCNSIRTSHNPPTPEMLELADEMGFLILDEIFDEWRLAKTENGYNTLWDEWAEKDMVAWIHRDRNHPSVIAWSIGNEIREQGAEDGLETCKFLVDICHREDPSRPTTAGFNNWRGAINNGLADAVDLPAWNYKPQFYTSIHKEHPDWTMYASETASTVSSRGEYFFPAEVKVMYTREPYHSSSFDLEYPSWATSPDREFVAQDSLKFMAGEFVWTGFDYLGEPTPYNVEWPSRSSYFGIIDLCGIPKDRYFLYQSQWTDKEVLHLLPHWNWTAGQKVSVHCYTSFDKGELFLNGKSLGVREKDPANLYTTYRLVWDDITYEPGEIKVVTLDENNNPLKEAVVKTAGEPAKIVLETDRNQILADGKELAFVTVSVVDENGTLCPQANNLIQFSTEGEGSIKAVGNGDPTSLESFVKPFRKTFNGKCMVLVQSSKTAGEFTLKAESEGLEAQEIIIKTSL
ncbi:MAG: glycoside hydrolase family 2 protein [Bacteroidetes bacterium]|nr:glycoside hydrolase family 2 protein [Bacteroidota bacterium]